MYQTREEPSWMTKIKSSSLSAITTIAKGTNYPIQTIERS